MFREPICDDCFLEEIGLKKAGRQFVDPTNTALDGEEWLLESKVEIQVDEGTTTQEGVTPEHLLDDMPTPRVGTGFQSIGDGDADDEGEFEDDFRGRSIRRSAIDINRDHPGLATSWSNWDMKVQQVMNQSKAEESSGGLKKATSLVRKMKDTEFKSFAGLAKRGLRTTIDRAKVVASKARSDTSRSPTKMEWASASSIVEPSMSVKKDMRNVNRPGEDKETIAVRPPYTTDTEELTALPTCGQVVSEQQHIVASVSTASEGSGDHNTTPTSISSSAHDLTQTPAAKWEDHLRQDLGERKFKHNRPLSSIEAGNKTDIHFDNVGGEECRLFSTSTDQSAPTVSNASSGNWAGLTEGQRLDEELAGRCLDEEYDCKRLLSRLTMQSSPAAASKVSLVSMADFAHETPVAANVGISIPDDQTPYGHAHKPSASSIASFTTAFSSSPQTSPPRPSPRIRQSLSFHPLTTMLQIATPTRPNWKPRNSSLNSPPLTSPYRVGLEDSPLRCSPTSDFACVCEHECCAICRCRVGTGRVVSCMCDEGIGCQAEKVMVKEAVGMDVCDQCAGAQ